MSIQERLQLILRMHNVSPSVFADKLGVQRSNVSHVLSGRNKPSLDFLEKIILQFPRVNAHWLITGEMSKEQQVEPKIEINESVKEVASNNTDDVSSDSKNKSLVKIVEFYADGTFKEFYPKKQ